MPHLVLDDFDNAGLWLAFDAGNNPSALIAVAVDARTHPFALEPNALGVDVQSGAAGHLLRRTIPATDLSAFDYLTFWHSVDVRAAGNPTDPLRLRLALGSAALPIGAPGNDWARYFTTERPGQWDYMRAALDDLPAAVRSALTTIEIQVVATDGAHRLLLDGLEAQAPQMVADVDAALLAQLDGQLQIGGNPVPAVIVPDIPAGAAQPAIRLTPYESVRSNARALTGIRRSDFTDTGHRLRPCPEAWDLFYAIECDGTTRADRAAMIDHVIGRFGIQGWLPMGNRALRIDQVDADEDAEDVLTAPHVLRYRIGAWIERGTPVPVLPVEDLVMATDLRTPATIMGNA